MTQDEFTKVQATLQRSMYRERLRDGHFCDLERENEEQRTEIARLRRDLERLTWKLAEETAARENAEDRAAELYAATEPDVFFFEVVQQRKEAVNRCNEEQKRRWAAEAEACRLREALERANAEHAEELQRTDAEIVALQDGVAYLRDWRCHQ